MNRADVINRLKAAERQLRARGVVRLFSYGSYARDEAREDSDIDVLVELDPVGEGSALARFLAPMDVLEEQFPGKEIGYGTRESIVPSYLPHIEQSLVRVF